jgi:hypothetical protein
VTSTVPGPPPGAVTVTELAPFTRIFVAATAPNLTAVAPVKLVPVMVTVPPPVLAPVLGLIDVTAGASDE